MYPKQAAFIFMILLILISHLSHLYAQLNWSDYQNNPIIDGNFDPGSILIHRPCVIHKDSTYHMWYPNTRQQSIGQFTLPQSFMGYANSTDGINWSLMNPTVIAPSADTSKFDQYHASQGWVISDNDTFKMWYWGYNVHYKTTGINTIGYAWSLDGLNWTLVNGPGIKGSVLDPVIASIPDTLGLATPCVVKEGNTYHMWYSQVIVYPFIFRIGYAQSSDGIHWTSIPGNGVNGSVLDWGTTGSFDAYSVAWPSVLQTDNGFMMHYFGAGITSGIGCATSTDGIQWTRLDGGGTNGACFDNAGTGCVLKMDEQYKMWYVIFDRDSVYLASSDQDVSIDENHDYGIPKNKDLLRNYPNPFNASTSILYDVLTHAHIRISIFNTQGQFVKRLVNTIHTPGQYKISWDGTDQFDQNVPSGIYIIRMISDMDDTHTQRILLVK